MASKGMRTSLGSYPYATVVFSITIALFITGLFGFLLILAGKLRQHIRENIEIQVYLDRSISDSDRARLGMTWANKPYVAIKDGGKPGIRFVPKEEAAKDFIKETGEDFTELLGSNPLRDAYYISVAENYATATVMKKLKSDFEATDGVFEAVYIEPLVEYVNQNLNSLALVLLGFASVLVGTCVLLINNTIRLALFSQRFLIRSMQLVGAKPWFIVKPFITRAVYHGAIGGVIASILLVLLLKVTENYYPDLTAPLELLPTIIVFALLIGAGASLGFLSAYRAVYKYLNLTLDELYV
jgi:cell division transport system permease protein